MRHNEIDIRRALANGEFSYVYQPKVSLVTNQVSGAEALLRWERQGETIYPADFVPQSEKSGLMPEITSVMLPRLIRDIQAIEKQVPNLAISFNACAQDFTKGNMVMTVIQAVAEGKVKQGKLFVEITETSLVENVNDLRNRFQVLLDAGIGLSMDDFGKGYSSIDLLSQLPFSCIKLDRDMVRRIGTSSKVEHIVESVCSLARKLGMKLIAEGVESHYAYNELSRHGCDHAQGFWISHPLPLNEYIDFARHSPSWGIGLAASGEGDAKWETSYCLPCCS